MKPIIIQPFASRFETPRVRISLEAFENSGIEIFGTERIPFADRTGPAFAKNLVRLLVARVQKLQKSGGSFPNGIHIYELGAGTGLLAKRVLDLLKNNHPEIYRKTILHLSDISKQTVAQLKALEAFKEHRGRVSFEVIDATKPKFKFKPLLVYFTNLIDSIPYQRHILIKDGQIYEVQIQTSLKEDAQIIDATSYPPKILEQKEISGLVSSPNPTRRLILAPQILTVLEEKSKFVPIAEVANISQEEREDLEKLAKSKVQYQPLVFNYSFLARTAIREIIRGLDNGGFIFFSDFGIATMEREQVLHIECGLLIFFSVNFPSLKQLAETAGKTCYLTANPLGFPQEMLIDTFVNDEQMGNLFEKKSVDETPKCVQNFLEETKKIVSESREEEGLKSEKIRGLYRSLPAEAKVDFLLLNNLALFLTQAGLYQEADFYADLLPENYGHGVGAIYYLVKGKVKQAEGKLQEAEEFFQKAVTAEGGRVLLPYIYLGELYWRQKRYREYIDVTKKYLKNIRKRGHLRGMVSIGAAQEKLFRSEAARSTLKMVAALGRKLKTISNSEKEALKQAEQWLEDDRSCVRGAVFVNPVRDAVSNGINLN